MKAPDNAAIERRLNKVILSNNGVKSQIKDHAFKLKYLENRSHEEFAFQRDISRRIDIGEELFEADIKKLSKSVRETERWNVVLTILVGLCLGITIVQYFL